ncbi:hypothetical protein PO073_09680 [Bacteroides thetaiotaomicron]|jgi:hypothetical protein|uniref:hypothetical protein n=1 Tax=Bacteroides thetaiotaomicron TaxID=818 RepID=UPI00189E097C|nr:hypothetical protein [Bacteroides thetaiotaomicron]MDC2172689.1 hypothetical protein [Bacteroides thetaiotaomicron]MDC2187917.1 hypothetical protein [Bacteroides thetaiotaomicron]
MIKAYNIDGNTCYGNIEDIDTIKDKLEELRLDNKLDSLEQPILLFEHDEDNLNRPLFQKIRIARYNNEWIL